MVFIVNSEGFRQAVAANLISKLCALLFLLQLTWRHLFIEPVA